MKNNIQSSSPRQTPIAKFLIPIDILKLVVIVTYNIRQLSNILTRVQVRGLVNQLVESSRLNSLCNNLYAKYSILDNLEV